MKFKNVMMLLLLMSLLLSACGAKPSTSNLDEPDKITQKPSLVSETKKQDNNSEEDNNSEIVVDIDKTLTNSSDWTFKSLRTPNIPDFNVIDVRIGGKDIKLKALEIPFDISFEKVEDVVTNNANITDTYDLKSGAFKEYTRYANYKDVGFVDAKELIQSIEGFAKNFDYKYTALDINTHIDNGVFSNNNSIILNISYPEDGSTSMNQDSVYELVKGLLNEEVAQYLVYAEPNNGEELKDHVEYGNGYYSLNRSIEHEEGLLKVRISFESVGNYLNGSITDVGLTPLEPAYDSYKYKVSDTFTNNTDIQDKTIDQLVGFIEDYYDRVTGSSDIDYKHITKTSVEYGHFKDYDQYTLSMSSDHGLGVEFNTWLNIAENPDESIKSIGTKAEGSSQAIDIKYNDDYDEDLTEKALALKEIYKTMMQEMSRLYPEIDFSEVNINEISADNIVREYKGTFTTTILGKEETFKWEMKAGSTIIDYWMGNWEIR